MRSGDGGGTAAWIAGTLTVPAIQGEPVAKGRRRCGAIGVFSSLWQLCPSEDCAWRWHSCLEPGDPGGAKCVAMLAASAAGAVVPSASGSWHSKVLFGWSFSVAWCV